MSSTTETSSQSGPLTAFFYGTLMVPAIFFRVTHGTETPPPSLFSLYTFTPALLRDFSRRKVHYADYPAIIASPGHSVLGCFVTGLTASDVSYLNMFEGSQYRRDECSVQLLPTDVLLPDGNADEGVMAKAEKEHSGGKAGQVKTWVYIWSDPISELEEEEWDYAEFVEEKLKNWVGGRNVEEYADAAEFQKSINGVEVVDLTGESPMAGGEEEYVWSGRKMTREEFGRLHDDFDAGRLNDDTFGAETSALGGEKIHDEDWDDLVVTNKVVGGEQDLAAQVKQDEAEESETEDMRTKRIASVIAGIARAEEAEAELDGKKVESKDKKPELDDGEIETLASAV